MTIFVRIEPDLRGKFHLTGSSKLPAGEGPVDIEGLSIADVTNQLAEQLHTDEEIIQLKPLRTLDIIR